MTAIEWLINELDLDNNPWNMKIINQSKEMEKQQIIDACNLDKRQYDNAEQYYNETFKKNKIWKKK